MSDEYKRKLCDMGDLNENIIIGKPWALRLLETSQRITKKAVLNWCSTIIKIGESDLNVDDYVDIFLQVISNLYEDLITDVDAIHEKTLDKITKLHDQLQNLCQNLHEEIPSFNFEKIPLNQLKMLIEQRVKEYEPLVETRRSELRELNQKQLTFCMRLGREPMLLSEFPLLPSPSEVNILKKKVQALETETMEREKQFFTLKKQIDDIVDELQYTPSSDFERKILNLPDYETLITNKDMEQLQVFSKKLMEELKNVRDEIGELKAKIGHLWDSLGIDVSEIEEFQQLNVGNSLKILNDLKEYYEKNLEAFDLLHEHQQLQNELKALDLNSRGADRFKNRGGRLLIEEKLRKKLKIEIQKIESKLVKMAETFFARRKGLLIDYITRASEDRAKEVKLKLSSKKQEQQASKSSSCSKKLFIPPAGTRTSSSRSPNFCSATERNVSSSLPRPSKKMKSSFEKKSSKNIGPTVNVSKIRRMSKKIEQQQRKSLSIKSSASSTKENFNGSTSYDDFEIEVSTKYGCRSTGYVIYEKPPLVAVTSPDGVPRLLRSP